MSDAGPYPPPGSADPARHPSPYPSPYPASHPPTGHHPAPPPGPNPAPPPAYSPGPPPGGWGAPAPGMPPGMPPGMSGSGYLGAAHKPGAVPLRPLGLGDIYDAAFKIIRFNPKATVGSAVLVASVAMLIPVIITAGLTFALDLSLDPSGEAIDDADVAGLIGSYASLLVGVVLQSIGLILVTGMIAHVVSVATIGRKMTLGEAWAATRGKRWRLIGLATVLGLATLLLLAAYAGLSFAVVLSGETVAIIVWFVLSLPALACVMCWFWVRLYYLPVPALMLEPIGVFGAIGRGYRLTSRAFWRTFGIALLTMLLAGVAGYMLSMPFAIVGQIGSMAGASSGYGVLILMVTQAISTVISTAFTAPFTSSVTSLQYVDQRIRKEAYDVELMTQAGITRS